NISHLKPFGCQVTILNTSNHLGKFEGKANESFLVGYATNSKAYKVYNLSSKKVEKTLNLRYLEDKPNVQGLGQEWYFDLDYLTNSLGIQDDDSESEYDEQAILVPSFPSNSFLGPKVNAIFATIENHLDYAEELARLQIQEHEAHSAVKKYGFEFSNQTTDMLHQAEIETRRNLVLAAGDPAGSIVSTGGVSVGSIPAGSIPTSSIPASNVPTSSVPASNVPASNVLASSILAGGVLAGSVPASNVPTSSTLAAVFLLAGIFSSSSYNDDLCADVTNLASSVVVDLVVTKRVNTIHPQSQILGELQSPVQTRIPLLDGKIAIGTKWILKNKKDARGIVLRNKARLVAQGHTQEEGIDYEEQPHFIVEFWH
nr:retrovirus-related Pol polyprotein from transposon TNT 1-94 [Tanacetum cinerariifolium]